MKTRLTAGVRRFSLAEGGERGSICTKISRFIHAGGRKTSQETLTDAQKSVFPDRESESSFPGHHVGTALYESGKKCAHRDALPSREEVGKRRDGETAAAQRRRCDGSTAAARYQHGSSTTAARQRRARGKTRTGAQANPPVHALRHRTSPIGASRSDALGADSVSQRFRCPEANPYAFSGILHSRMKPTMNSMAMDSTPIEGLPVICVKNDTRNVPMIAAYFPKMSKKP